tara:strand:- start:1443 stop:2249 length:807 start_codon:yes stop_codon:yes gene_type:complete
MNRFLILFLIFLVSCSQSTPNQRNSLIKKLNSNKFSKNIYSTKFFNIYSLEKIKNNQKLTIYVEGDGMSWVDRFTPSSDPTPTDPLAFRMASIDGEDNVIYLARPCQYEWSNNCNKDIWTISQYSLEVLNSYKEIIHHLSKIYKEIHLVGYSGGAGIVMYLGSIENVNVKSIRTIAGNINHNELSKILNISRLKKSVNFYSIENKTREIPQIHYYGLKDKTVPNELQISFAERNINNNCIKIQSVKKANHNRGWSNFWIDNNSKLPSC